jgi:hypothetical protein
MLQALLITAVAGIVGTGLGGVVGLFFGKSSAKTLSYILSFAAGIMLSIVYFELIPQSIQLSGVYVTIISVAAGVVIIKYLNAFVDKITSSKEVHTVPEEMNHQEGILHASTSGSLFKAGIIMFAAIALHNLPEGMAIGSGSTHSEGFGLVLALLIAMHNIPRGDGYRRAAYSRKYEQGQGSAFDCTGRGPHLGRRIFGCFFRWCERFCSVHIPVIGGGRNALCFLRRNDAPGNSPKPRQAACYVHHWRHFIRACRYLCFQIKGHTSDIPFKCNLYCLSHDLHSPYTSRLCPITRKLSSAIFGTKASMGQFSIEIILLQPVHMA